MNDIERDKKRTEGSTIELEDKSYKVYLWIGVICLSNTFILLFVFYIISSLGTSFASLTPEKRRQLLHKMLTGCDISRKYRALTTSTAYRMIQNFPIHNVFLSFCTQTHTCTITIRFNFTSFILYQPFNLCISTSTHPRLALSHTTMSFICMAIIYYATSRIEHSTYPIPSNDL